MAYHFIGSSQKTARIGGKQKQGVNLTNPVKRAYDGANKAIKPPANAELKPLPVVPVAAGQHPPPGVPAVGISRSKARDICDQNDITWQVLDEALAGRRIPGVIKEGNRYFIPEGAFSKWIVDTVALQVASQSAEGD
jgi:hypothetical protein